MVEPTLPEPMMTALLFDDSVSILLLPFKKKIQKINPLYYNTTVHTFQSIFLCKSVFFCSIFNQHPHIFHKLHFSKSKAPCHSIAVHKTTQAAFLAAALQF
jgi:hypothetical protein